MGVRHRLAQILAEKGMTQTTLAGRIGQPVSWVNNRIHGVSAIKAGELPSLAAGLQVPITAFFEPQAAPEVPHEEAAHTYADTFVRSLAQAWRQDMSDPERQFIETIVISMRRYRDELLARTQ